jgi:hypothetical protein
LTVGTWPFEYRLHVAARFSWSNEMNSSARTGLLLTFLLRSIAFADLTVGSGEIRRTVGERTGTTTEFHLGSNKVVITGEEFRVALDGRTFTARDFESLGSESQPGKVSARFRREGLQLTVEYSDAGPNGVRKRLRLRPAKSVVIEEVVVESLSLPVNAAVTVAKSSPLNKEIGGLPVCAFVELGGYGAFLSLDFAHSEIESTAGALRIGYQPYQKVGAGEEYLSHSVTSNAYRLSGRKGGQYDDAAADAFRRYIRFDYAPPYFNAPQLFYTSIVNRYTEVDRSVPVTPVGQRPIINTIFYTLSDANYYMLHPEKVPEEIDFCKGLSMEVCQLYEGPFEWLPGNPAAALARQIGEYARDRGVKIGLYTGANHLTAPHFNHYKQDKGRAEWKLLNAQGKRGAYCWGSEEFANWFTDALIEASTNFNFRNANFDFLDLTPCFDKSHGHPLGPKGLYRQVLNLVRSLDRLRAAVPGYVYDSNLGWPPLVPKIAKSMDGFYLTDPHFTVYLPVLNTTEHLDNSRRYQMVSYFLNNLTPVEYFRNCEYFLVPNSVVPDSSIFEYGILQGLALTPNLQLGEARALFDRLSSSQQERARRFLARWTAFVKQNFDFYANTMVLSGLPKIGQVEVYAHAKGGRSFVFLVNPNPFPSEASFSIDQAIGLSASGPYAVHELYPEDQLLEGRHGIELQRGESFSSRVPSRTVRVLEIGAATAYAKPPLRITGAPATYDRFPDHYRLRLEGAQGEKRTIGLYLPPGEKLLRLESDGQTLETKFIQGGDYAMVQFPKDLVQEHVLAWTVRAAPLADGVRDQFWNSAASEQVFQFPQLNAKVPAANFLGARIENLLNERYPRELTLYFGPGNDARRPPVTNPVQKDHVEASVLAEGNLQCWYQSRFPVAWVPRFIPPAPNEQHYISLNFRSPADVAETRAWLNGKEIQVEKFQYWRGPEWARNYYLNGTPGGLKRGENTLTLFVRYSK